GPPACHHQTVVGFVAASFGGGRKSGKERGRLLNWGSALKEVRCGSNEERKNLWIRRRTTLSLAKRTANRCGLRMQPSASIAMSALFFMAWRRSIACYFRLLWKGSRAARRHFTLSIQNCATSTYSDFPQAASTSLRSRRMDNSSSTIGTKSICATVISIGTECLPA